MHEEIDDRDEGHGPDERTAESDEPESAYELLQRGRGLLERRHNAQAAVVLERAARLEPGKASILEALGRAYFNSGQAERVARDVRGAARHRPVGALRAFRAGAEPQAASGGSARPGRTCASRSR